MNLNEHRSNLESILDVEMKDAKPLTGDALEKLQFVLELNYAPHIFYNSTNIILTEREEFDKLKSIVKQFEDVLKLEMTQFNMYLYIGSYVNCQELKSILGT